MTDHLESCVYNRELIPFPTSFQRDTVSDIRANIFRADVSNLHRVWRVRCELDVDRLHDSLHLVANSHCMLSATLKVTDGILQPAFFLNDRDPARLVIEWLQEPRAGLSAEVAQFVWQKFDIASGQPLIRWFIIRVATSDYVIGYVLHHLIGDAASKSIIDRQLWRDYETPVRIIPGQNSPSWRLYADYARSRQACTTEDDRQRMAFWRTRLRAVPQFFLPRDRDPPAGTDRTIVESLDLRQTDVNLVRKIAAQERAAPFIVLLAAHYYALRLISGINDIATKVVRSGRDSPAFFSIVGCFTEFVCIRLQFELHERVTPRYLIQVAKKAALEIQTVRETPYFWLNDSLDEQCRPERLPAINFVDHVAFERRSYTPKFLETFPVPPAPEHSTLPSRMLYFMNLHAFANQISGYIVYSTGHIDPPRVAGLVRNFHSCLRLMCETPDAAVNWEPQSGT